MTERPNIGDRVRFRRRVYVVTKLDGATATIANDARTEYLGVTWANAELQPAGPRKRMGGPIT